MKSMSMTKTLLCVAAMGLALVGLAACGGSGGGSAEAAVRSVRDKELDAFQKQDPRALYNLYSSEARSACPYDDDIEAELQSWMDSAIGGVSIAGRIETQNANNESLNLTLEDVKFEYADVNIQIDGDSAEVSSTLNVTVGKVKGSGGQDVWAYQKIDGHWYPENPEGCGDSSSDSGNSGATPGQPTAASTVDASSGGEDIASLREVLKRIADDASEADLNSALKMKDTMTRYLMRVRAGADQSTHYYLDDAWSRFVDMAESDSESVRFTAAYVQAGAVVGYIDDAEEALVSAASAQTRTAARAGTPTATTPAGTSPRPGTATPATRVATPIVQAAPTISGEPFGGTATFVINLQGQSFQLRGSQCTLTYGGTILALDIDDGSSKVSLQAGDVLGPPFSTQLANGGGKIPWKIAFTTAGTRWISITADLGTAFNVTPDRASGTFSASFLSASGNATATGSFTC